MKAQSPDNIHWSFWLIAATTLVWNIICVVNFFWQINAEAIVNMPESHRLIIENRPLWATYAFAIAGFGGALGCLLLLLRNSRAYYLFALSLMAVILQLLPNFEMINLSVFAPPMNSL